MTDAERQRKHRENFRDKQPVTNRGNAAVAALEAHVRELKGELAQQRQQNAVLRETVTALQRLLAQARAQAKKPPPVESKEIAKLHKRIMELHARIRELHARIRELNAARLRAVTNAPKGTLVLPKKDRQLIRQCLHPDFNPSAEKRKQLLDEASKIFNELSIREK